MIFTPPRILIQRLVISALQTAAAGLGQGRRNEVARSRLQGARSGESRRSGPETFNLEPETREAPGVGAGLLADHAVAPVDQRQAQAREIWGSLAVEVVTGVVQRK